MEVWDLDIFEGKWENLGEGTHEVGNGGDLTGIWDGLVGTVR